MKRAFFILAIGFLAPTILSCAQQKYSQITPTPTTAEQANTQMDGVITNGPTGPVQYGVSDNQSVTMQSGTALESSTTYTPFGGRVGGFTTSGDLSAGPQPAAPSQPAQPTGSPKR